MKQAREAWLLSHDSNTLHLNIHVSRQGLYHHTSTQSQHQHQPSSHNSPDSRPRRLRRTPVRLVDRIHFLEVLDSREKNVHLNNILETRPSLIEYRTEVLDAPMLSHVLVSPCRILQSNRSLTVCACMSPGTTWPVAGSRGRDPEAKTKPLATMAWE
jgi:hypothetical protein